MMNLKKLRVLLVIGECNPDWISVPLEGYRYYQEISKLVDVTLVTHQRNREALEKRKEHQGITYISESKILGKYYALIERLTARGRINWPLYNALAYPLYEEFNQKVYRRFKGKIVSGNYDLIHVITPMMPRYPVSLVALRDFAPVVLGPVNGGVPYPKGFQKIARQEKAYFNFLRVVGRYLIPGYIRTYKESNKILAGSTYTLNMLKKLFSIQDKRIELFYENGIVEEFLKPVNRDFINKSKVDFLFVGRLVPYKCADIVIAAIARLEDSVRKQMQLTIVGDGSERATLEQSVRALNLTDTVHFVGWVNHEQVIEHYRKADVFCFPSVREFGGAVVLEAMACGLPCIVVNNGGIGEYISEETGFKIEPLSREFLLEELTNKIQLLTESSELRERMSIKAVERAREFEWSHKARKVLEVYEDVLLST